MFIKSKNAPYTHQKWCSCNLGHWGVNSVRNLPGDYNPLGRICFIEVTEFTKNVLHRLMVWSKANECQFLHFLPAHLTGQQHVLPSQSRSSVVGFWVDLNLVISDAGGRYKCKHVKLITALHQFWSLSLYWCSPSPRKALSSILRLVWSSPRRLSR